MVIVSGEYFRVALKYCLATGEWGNQEALACAANVSQSTISDIKNGRYYGKQGVQERIAKACGYDLPEFLLLGKHLLIKGNNNVSDEPSMVLDCPVRSVPIFDANCEVCKPIWIDGIVPVAENQESIVLPQAWLSESSFCFKVHNDMMAPTLLKGDVVLVDSNANIADGDIVFATMPESKIIIRRYRVLKDRNVIILEADNRSHAAVVLDLNNSMIIAPYKIVRLISRRF